ncbi:MAG: hypothetical protein JRG72_11380 [Deltaproteobacteria bacterium]|nr:hypothetical protein [Deltaproteobacteria bacterium]
MADYFAASIEFPASALEDAEIKKALKDEGVKFEPLKGDPFREVEAKITEGIFYLYKAEARWGQFEELESLLRSKGIPFDRQSGQAFEFIPELVIFRPAKDGAPNQRSVVPGDWSYPGISGYKLS